MLIGGGYVMLPLLQRTVVDRRQWLTDQDLLDMYAISQSTPGIIAVNTATLVGYRRAGIPGAASATVGIVLPAFAMISLVAVFYQRVRDIFWVDAGFSGMRIAVSALLATSITGLLYRACRTPGSIGIAAGAFVAMTFLGVSPVPVILVSGGLGLVLFRKRG